MAWKNPDLTLFHGTLERHARSIGTAGVSLAAGRTYVDFGQGFYLTSSRHQAEQWANTALRKWRRKSRGPGRAAVLAYDIDRNALANLSHLVFTLENVAADFWAFVAHCRATAPVSHGCAIPGRTPTNLYDVVIGPVTSWPQSIVLKDCDQWSFHTSTALKTLPSRSHPGDDARLLLPPSGDIF
ncbi:MAG: DUF3990 domain-containing protein [Pseudomonadota bacterium]